MSVRCHKVVASSLFLFTTILTTLRRSIQLSYSLLFKCPLHLLSDPAAVCAVYATVCRGRCSIGIVLAHGHANYSNYDE
jgi:hypothetical protein